MTDPTREHALRRTQMEVFDLAVVGGGITGAGVAREASLRGLSACLLEARDFASGTSSRSTRLIHGGLRYLRMGDVRLVRESLRESLSSTVSAQVGALLSRKAFNNFKKRLDYSEYGGAPLLGLRGVCIVGHGSSNDRAIMNGIRVAAEFAQTGVNTHLEHEFTLHPPVPHSPTAAEVEGDGL